MKAFKSFLLEQFSPSSVPLINFPFHSIQNKKMDMRTKLLVIFHSSDFLSSKARQKRGEG